MQTASAAKQVNVSSLKDLSWSKANEILETRYGSMALNGLDNTSSLADSYLDYYMPEEEEESDETQRSESAILPEAPWCIAFTIVQCCTY